MLWACVSDILYHWISILDVRGDYVDACCENLKKGGVAANILSRRLFSRKA